MRIDGSGRADVSKGELRPDFIPAFDYVSPDFHKLEMERLWPRVWQIACRIEEIPRVGDYVNYEIGEESILIIRSTADTIKAFYNVCSHRGRRLKEDARGCAPTLKCNYHAWCYDLNGKPTVIPGRDDWKNCPEFDDAELSLKPVKLDTWAGFVWINMDPNCEPLRKFLSPVPEKVDAFEFENCRLKAYKTIIFPVNWKVVLEAFVEGYHTPGTHPQMLRFGKPHFPSGDDDGKGDKLHATHTAHFDPPMDPKTSKPADPRVMLLGMVQELYDTLGAMFHDQGLAAAHRIISEVPEGTPAEQVYAKYFDFQKEEILKSGAAWPEQLTQAHLWSTDWQIFPNTSVLPSVDGALWYRMRPNGNDANSCIFDIWILGRYAPGKEPKVEQEVCEDYRQFKNKIPFLEQDFTNLIAVQKGMKSRAWRGARTNPVQEVSVYNLHRVLHMYLFGSRA